MFSFVVKKRNITYRAHQDEAVFIIPAWYVKKWLTYTTFGSSIYRVWKNGDNSNAYLNMLRRSHTIIKGTIGFLSLSCIWKTPFLLTFVKLEIWHFLPDHYKLLKIAPHDPMNTVIEFLGQSWSGNMCRMTYLWLENSRDLLWHSFDLEVYL